MVLLIETPCLLKDGFFYYPATLDLESSAEIISEDADSIELGNVRSPLYKGESLKDHIAYFAGLHEDLFTRKANQRFNKFIKKVKSHKKEGFSSSLLKEEKIVSSILLGVMPRFVSFHKKSAISDLLSGKSLDEESFLSVLKRQFSPEEAKIYDRNVEQAKRLSSSDPQERKDNLKELFGGQYMDPWTRFADKAGRRQNSKTTAISNLVRQVYGESRVETATGTFFIDEERVHNLTREVKGTTRFRLNREDYSTGEKIPINFVDFLADSIEELLIAKKKQEFLEETITEPDSLASITGAERLALTLFMREVNNFEKGNFGVKKNAEGYTVYIKIPEYALANREDEIFLFPPAKVGINISLSQSNTLNPSDPKVLDSYTHPFLSGDGANQYICIGGYSYRSKQGKLERAVEALSIGKQILLEGYRSSSNTMRPYRQLETTNFKNYKVSRRNPKLLSGEVKITNR